MLLGIRDSHLLRLHLVHPRGPVTSCISCDLVSQGGYYCSGKRTENAADHHFVPVRIVDVRQPSRCLALCRHPPRLRLRASVYMARIFSCVAAKHQSGQIVHRKPCICWVCSFHLIRKWSGSHIQVRDDLAESGETNVKANDAGDVRRGQRLSGRPCRHGSDVSRWSRYFLDWSQLSMRVEGSRKVLTCLKSPPSLATVDCLPRGSNIKVYSASCSVSKNKLGGLWVPASADKMYAGESRWRL